MLTIVFSPAFATLLEASSALPSAWTAVGPSPRDTQIELVFAVKQRNLHQLHDTLMAVSTPGEPKYGQHLTNEQVHSLVAPTAESVAAVGSYCAEFGATVERLSPNSDLMQATVPVAVAERMLGASYSLLRHETGVEVHRIASAGYTLPAAVAAAVDFVAPTVHVPGVRRAPQPEVLVERIEAARRLEGDGFGDKNVPKSLRTLYSVGLDIVGNASTNKQAVTAFLGQKYSEKDLQKFWSSYCDGITCGKGLPKLVGEATKGMAGVESMLDIETITGVAGNIETEFWGYSGKSPDNPDNEPFMKWLAAVSATADADVPKLFSTSYGEDENSWSMPAATRLNAEFMKAGARGISLLYASGDEGANCKGSKLVPEGPGSSPYVTAVGGTQPTSGFPSPGSESAVGLSSGGFSNYWAQPAWQRDAVAGYLASGADLPPSSSGYNTSGRAYPDISAQAVNFCVTPFGCGVAGTSCATPTASGVFGLLNDVRLQAGKPTLGFLNPFIYQNKAAFNDVTTGSSSGGCGFPGDGWPAAKGWDAVTGVGTPNYAKLAAAVKALA